MRNKRRSENNVDGDKKISFAIVVQFCMLITNYAFKEVFRIYNPDVRALTSLVFMLIVGLLYIKNIKLVFRRIGRFLLMSYIFSASIFLINILMFPENVIYLLDVSFWFFLIALPTALYYLSIFDKSIFMSMLIKSAYYQMFAGIIIFVSKLLYNPGYDMAFSYQILIPVVILLYKITHIKYRTLDVILIISGIILILSIGSRGPIVAIIAYSILLYVLKLFENRKRQKTVIINLFTFFVSFILILNINRILLLLEKKLIEFNISSRTLRMIIHGTGDFTTGRSSIYDATILNILEKPFLGYGIAGDRVFLSGTYPHNIFLELLAQFGIIVGSIIAVIFLTYSLKGIFFNKNHIEKHLAVMFFGIGFIQLLFSGSYLTSSNFWLFIAICTSSVHFKKTKSNVFERKI